MAEQLVEMNQQLENPNEAIALFGVNDAHLKVIERELSVSIVT
ncbi:phosphate starvation-inducible protein PhoH, partial [Brevibacillus sp. SIMBA_076]